MRRRTVLGALAAALALERLVAARTDEEPRTWEAPPPWPPPGARQLVVPVDDGAELSATVVGLLGAAAGPVVVCAHGWAGDQRMWSAVVAGLRELGCTVVTFDQRGHGRSRPGRDPIGVPRLARDLLAVLDRLELDDVVLVGHSGGGFVVVSLLGTDAAVRARVRGCVLAASAARGERVSAGELKLLGSSLLTRVTSLATVGALPLLHTFGPGADPRAVDVARRAFSATPGPVRRACFEASGAGPTPDLAVVDVPTIVVTGGRDGVVPTARSEALASALPQARLERLDHAGHMLPLEAPNRLVAAAHALLADHASPSPA